jgi:hypothetical protein
MVIAAGKSCVDSRGLDYEFVENCQVEWHKSRGTLYVHNDQGRTILRIQELPGVRPSATLENVTVDVRASDSTAAITFFAGL